MKLETLDKLFAHWGRSADKYEALNRLREHYERQREIIAEPYQQKLLAFAERHGAAAVTPEVRDSLYAEVRQDMTALRDWYGQNTKEIIDHYEKNEAK
jgi:hypothetical protein